MSKVRVHNLSMSADGYVAGPDQSLDTPLGVGGERLHEWVFETRGGREHMGDEGGEAGVDNDFFHRSFEGLGAWIMGRNMFGPIRGEWTRDASGEDWKGWWGDDPPYHCPVFVLTHHAGGSIVMRGGTTFHFVDDGIESALKQAQDAAGDLDIRIGGGASTVQQYLNARLIDDLHVAIVPILLGSGERLFDNLVGGIDGYECVEFVSSPRVAHVRFAPKRKKRS